MITEEKVEIFTDFCDEKFESDQLLSEEQDSNKTRSHVKKLRSIKFSKSPSLKFSTRRSKPHFRNIGIELFCEEENSPSSTTSSRFSQKSAPPLIRRSSFKSGKRILARMSSKKLKKKSTDLNQMKLSNEVEDEKRRTSLAYSKSKSISPGQKSSPRTLTRKLSLKPLRFSPTKSKKSPLKSHSGVSRFPDLSVERATCSSILKDSKFHDTLQGFESIENSAMKVCTFSYCSLHGHRHANVPPLKRFISMRRRSMKNQRSTRGETRAACKERSSGKGKKESLALLVEEVDRENELGGYGEEEAKINDFVEKLVGETSNPLSHIDENRNQVCEFPIVEPNSAPVETSTVSPSSDELEMDSRSVGESKERNECLYASPRKLEAKDEKENLEPADGFFRFPPTKDSELNGNKDMGTSRMQVQLKDQKYVRMWRLMYKHTVKGVSGTVENQVPFDNVDKAEQVKEAEVVLEPNDSQVLQDAMVESGNADAGKQQMELYQNDAVKLVQEAFDEILLPEIQDDRSVTSGVSSDQEILEQGNDGGISKDEKTPSKWGGKSGSKSWSNLKKILVLKRFVKALEKVKKINPREPSYLPLQPDPEAEKVNLRRQTSEERKNAEEWMLDYALQKVISKLDPPQQRRVAMLVKAFETVLPPSDLKTSPRLSLAEHSQVDRVQSCISSFVQIGEKSGKESDENEYAEEFPKLEDIEREEDVSIDQQDSSNSSDELNSVDIVSTFHEALQDEHVQVAPEQIDANLRTEETKLDDTNTSVTNAIAASKEENGVTEESESDCQNDAAQDAQSEQQSYTKLWSLVYKHMSSANDGTELSDEVDEKRLDNAKTMERNVDMNMKDDTADDQKAALRRIEAIKLIEKAIDDILLPENQDNSGSTNCVSTNENSREEDRKEAEEFKVPDFENRADDDITPKEEEEEKASTEPKMSRSWSNLKKMILLKRFIKALENVKKFTPRGPRFLPLEAGQESEKVNLKHQDTDERKNAEEWMLDYAIQQAVTKLTPARKRKVKLLVEAFETVTPGIRR
ncbi:calmodulin binding protein PICBP-like [Cannabis sativa]|uniref:calmodulin binding protein PICBP-like n=1 Tax=Cannabis sativa TaxID=3483 RepID=UPI0029C9D1B8|nr:calmodulin binding protein PICBP-like [Cannabis sativa]